MLTEPTSYSPARDAHGTVPLSLPPTTITTTDTAGTLGNSEKGVSQAAAFFASPSFLRMYDEARAGRLSALLRPHSAAARPNPPFGQTALRVQRSVQSAVRVPSFSTSSPELTFTALPGRDSDAQKQLLHMWELHASRVVLLPSTLTEAAYNSRMKSAMAAVSDATDPVATKSFPTFRARIARTRVREAVPQALGWLVWGGAQVVFFNDASVQLLVQSATKAMSPLFHTMITTNPRLVEENITHMASVVQRSLLRVPAGAFRVLGDQSLSEGQRATRVAAQVVQPLVVNLLLMTPPATLAAIAGVSVLGLGVTLMEDPKGEHAVFRTAERVASVVAATAGSAFVSKAALTLVLPTNAPFVAGSLQYYVASSLTSNVTTSALTHVTDGYVTDFKSGPSLLQTLLDALDRDITVVRFRHHVRSRVRAAGKRAAKVHDLTWRRHVSPHLPAPLKHLSVAFVAKFTTAVGLLFAYASLPYHLDVLRHELEWAQPLWESASQLTRSASGALGPLFQSEAVSWMYNTRTAAATRLMGRTAATVTRNTFYYELWCPLITKLIQDKLGISTFVKTHVAKSIRLLKEQYGWVDMVLTHKPFEALLTTELANRWRMQYLLDASIEHLFVHSPLAAFLSIATDPYAGVPQKAAAYLSEHAATPLVRSMHTAWDARADVYVTVQQAMWHSAEVFRGRHPSADSITGLPDTPVPAPKAADSSEDVMETLAQSFVETLERPVDTAWMEVHEAFEAYAARVPATAGRHTDEPHAASPLRDTRSRLQQRVTDLQQRLSAAQTAQTGTPLSTDLDSTSTTHTRPTTADQFVVEAAAVHKAIMGEMQLLDAQTSHRRDQQLTRWRDQVNRETKRKYLRDIDAKMRTLRLAAGLEQAGAASSTKSPTEPPAVPPTDSVQHIRDTDLDDRVSVEDLREYRDAYNSIRRNVDAWKRLTQQAGALHGEHLPPALSQQLRRVEQLVRLTTNQPHRQESPNTPRLSALRFLRSVHGHQHNQQLLDMLLQDVSLQVGTAVKEQQVTEECRRVLQTLGEAPAPTSSTTSSSTPPAHTSDANARPTRLRYTMPTQLAQREALVYLHKHVLSRKDVETLLKQVPEGTSAVSYEDIRGALSPAQRRELDIAEHDLRSFWDRTSKDMDRLRKQTTRAYENRFYTKLGSLHELKTLVRVGLPQSSAHLRATERLLRAKRTEMQTAHDASFRFRTPPQYSFASAADVMQLHDPAQWFEQNKHMFASAEDRAQLKAYHQARQHLRTTPRTVADMASLHTMAELDQNEALQQDITGVVQEHHRTLEQELRPHEQAVVRDIRGLYVEQATQQLQTLLRRAQQHSWFGRQPEHRNTLRLALAQHRANVLQLLTTSPSASPHSSAVVSDPQVLLRLDVAEWGTWCDSVGVATVDQHASGLMQYAHTLADAQKLIHRESANVLDREMVGIVRAEETNRLPSTTSTSLRMDSPPESLQHAQRRWASALESLRQRSREHPDSSEVYTPMLDNLDRLQQVRMRVHHQHQSLLHRLTRTLHEAARPPAQSVAHQTAAASPETTQERSELHADIRDLQQQIERLYDPQQLLAAARVRESTIGLTPVHTNPEWGRHRASAMSSGEATPDQVLLTAVRHELHQPQRTAHQQQPTAPTGSAWPVNVHTMFGTAASAPTVHARLGAMAALLELHHQADDLIRQQVRADDQTIDSITVGEAAVDAPVNAPVDVDAQHQSFVHKVQRLETDVTAFQETALQALAPDLLSSLQAKQHTLRQYTKDQEQQRRLHVHQVEKLRGSVDQLEQRLARPFRYAPHTPSVQQWAAHLAARQSSWFGSVFVARPDSRSAQRAREWQELHAMSKRIHQEWSALHAPSSATAAVASRIKALDVQCQQRTTLLLQHTLRDWKDLHTHMRNQLESGEVPVYANGVAVHDDQAAAVTDLMRKAGADVLEQEARAWRDALVSRGDRADAAQEVQDTPQGPAATTLFDATHQTVQQEHARIQSVLGDRWSAHLQAEQSRVLRQTRTRHRLTVALERVQQQWDELQSAAEGKGEDAAGLQLVSAMQRAVTPPTTSAPTLSQAESSSTLTLPELQKRWDAHQQALGQIRKSLQELDQQLATAEKRGPTGDPPALTRHSLLRDTHERLRQHVNAHERQTVHPLLATYIERQVVKPAEQLVKEATTLQTMLQDGSLSWQSPAEQQQAHDRMTVLAERAARVQADYQRIYEGYRSTHGSSLWSNIYEADRSGMRQAKTNTEALGQMLPPLRRELETQLASPTLRLPTGTQTRVDQLAAFRQLQAVSTPATKRAATSTSSPKTTFANAQDLRTWLHDTLHVGTRGAHTLSEAVFARRFEEGVRTGFRNNPFEHELQRLTMTQSVGALAMVMRSREMQSHLHITKWSTPAHLHQQLMEPARVADIQSLGRRMHEYRKVAERMGADYKQAAARARHDSIEARHIDWSDWGTFFGRKRQHPDSLRDFSGEYLSDPKAAEQSVVQSVPLYASRVLQQVPDRVQAHLLLGALSRLRHGEGVADPSLDAYALDPSVSDLDLHQFMRAFDTNLRSIEAALPETRAQFDWNTALYGVCTRALKGAWGGHTLPATSNTEPLGEADKSRIATVLDMPGVRAALLTIGGRPLVDAANGMERGLQQLPMEVLYGDSREYWTADSSNNVIHFNKVSHKGHTFLAGQPGAEYWNMNRQATQK